MLRFIYTISPNGIPSPYGSLCWPFLPPGRTVRALITLSAITRSATFRRSVICLAARKGNCHTRHCHWCSLAGGFWVQISHLPPVSGYLYRHAVCSPVLTLMIVTCSASAISRSVSVAKFAAAVVMNALISSGCTFAYPSPALRSIIFIAPLSLCSVKSRAWDCVFCVFRCHSLYLTAIK